MKVQGQKKLEFAFAALKADYERQGKKLEAYQFERIIEKQNFNAEECIDLINRLKDVGITFTIENIIKTESPKESREISKTTETFSQNFFGNAILPILNIEEEKRLIRQVKIANKFKNIPEHDFSQDIEKINIIKNSEKALEKLVMSNMKFIIKISCEYRNASSIPLDDLIQEGIAGFIKGIELFDLNLGNKLITYAVWWIRQGIRKTIMDQGEIVRYPANVHNDIIRYNKTYSTILNSHPEKKPTPKEIADEILWDIEKVLFISQLKNISTEQIDPGSTSTNSFNKFHVRNSPIEPTDNLAKKKMMEKFIQTILMELSDLEREIINKRFGLNGIKKELTLAEIASEKTLTRERIRQIEDSAKKKISKKLLRYPEIKEFYSKLNESSQKDK